MQICLRSAPLPPALPRCSRRHSGQPPTPTPSPSLTQQPPLRVTEEQVILVGALALGAWRVPGPAPSHHPALPVPLPPAHTCSGGCVHHPRCWCLSGYLTSQLLGTPQTLEGFRTCHPETHCLGRFGSPDAAGADALSASSTAGAKASREEGTLPAPGRGQSHPRGRSSSPEVRLDRRTCDNHPTAVAFPTTPRRCPALAAPRAVGLASPTRGRSSSRTAHGLWSTQTKPNIWLFRFSSSCVKIPTCTDTKHIHAFFCA